MRIGWRGGRTPPHKAAGLVLIALGGIIMLIAMPFFVYLALLGGLISYLGYSVRKR